MTNCGCIEILDIPEPTGISSICDCNVQRIIGDVEQIQIRDEKKELVQVQKEKLEDEQASRSRESLEVKSKGGGGSGIVEESASISGDKEQKQEVKAEDKGIDDGRDEAEEQKRERVNNDYENVPVDLLIARAPITEQLAEKLGCKSISGNESCKCGSETETKPPIEKKDDGNVFQSPGETSIGRTLVKDEGNVPGPPAQSSIGQSPVVDDGNVPKPPVKDDENVSQPPVESTLEHTRSFEEGKQKVSEPNSGACTCGSAIEKLEREQLRNVQDEGEDAGSCKCGTFPVVKSDRGLLGNVEDEEAEKISQPSRPKDAIEGFGIDTTEVEMIDVGGPIKEPTDRPDTEAKEATEGAELLPKSSPETVPDSSNIKSCTCNSQVVIPVEFGTGYSTVIIIQGPNTQPIQKHDSK